ncbi:hypothetical protein BK026_13485 [Alteromonas sp. V450]|nr:hypothetical protein BK026_13485 [Alteromonas sp. V450]
MWEKAGKRKGAKKPLKKPQHNLENTFTHHKDEHSTTSCISKITKFQKGSAFLKIKGKKLNTF